MGLKDKIEFNIFLSLVNNMTKKVPITGNKVFKPGCENRKVLTKLLSSVVFSFNSNIEIKINKKPKS